MHHVNERVAPADRLYWDLGVLLWGAGMLAAGWALMRRGQRELALPPATPA